MLRERQRRDGRPMVVVDRDLPAANVERLGGHDELEPVAAVAEDAPEVRVGRLAALVVEGHGATVQKAGARDPVVLVEDERGRLGAPRGECHAREREQGTDGS